MKEFLCLTINFLDSRFHGRCEGGQPEWPPSPLRLFQSLIASNSERIENNSGIVKSLEWLERQPPPIIVTPKSEQSQPYCLSVPNNALDLVGKAWSRGNYFSKGDSDPSTHRSLKNVRPTRLLGGDSVHFLWEVKNPPAEGELIGLLAKSANRIIALGWGIDLVYGLGRIISSDELNSLEGEVWHPYNTSAVSSLRAPVQGTLSALRERHIQLLNRVDGKIVKPVDPLTQFRYIGYRRTTDPLHRPFVIFELRHNVGSFCVYPQRKLIHIAGMVRRQAIDALKKSPPSDAAENWVDHYIAGHQNGSGSKHKQLSYIPLPSIGHHHSDQSIRRVMVTAPIGDDEWLEFVALRLEGRQLNPEPGFANPFIDKGLPSLVRSKSNTFTFYNKISNEWSSVTPVILPGHDDHKPEKTRRLIEKALLQSGIEQPCDFEWSPFSRFRKSYSSHKYGKYGKDGKLAGYIRPDHLLTQTAVHLTLHFKDGLKVPGPIAIGAGRHCGLGLLAAIDSHEASSNE